MNELFREKIENSSSGALVLHMTSNLIISRRCQDDNGKEMNQNVKRTCRACRALPSFLLKVPNFPRLTSASNAFFLLNDDFILIG